jgi:hypothetical protein
VKGTDSSEPRPTGRPVMAGTMGPSGPNVTPEMARADAERKISEARARTDWSSRIRIILVWDQGELAGAALANQDEIEQAVAELQALIDDDAPIQITIYVPDSRKELLALLGDEGEE